MIHTYSLIHDDLPSLDNDDLRRGKPTCHKLYGEAIAILAGDALLTEAFRICQTAATRSGSTPRSSNRSFSRSPPRPARRAWLRARSWTCFTKGRKGRKTSSSYIHSRKTTALIRAAVRVGAIMGGEDAGPWEVHPIRRVSGLAFQIMDDLLDVEGDEETVGKRLKKDTSKQTYVKHYGVVASKIKLEQLTDEAIRSVQFLGENSAILTELAQFVSSRAF